MQVFDFDNTIYHGESVYDFALFVIKRKLSLVKYIPKITIILIKYKKCQMNKFEFKEELEKYTKVFLDNKDFLEKMVVKFWQKNKHKLDQGMLKKIKKDDVILTCSPYFLIGEIKSELKTKHLICSEIDVKKGKISFLNFGENKVKKFKEKYKNKKIDVVYTDSYNDQALIDIATNAYLVKKGKCQKIK